MGHYILYVVDKVARDRACQWLGAYRTPNTLPVALIAAIGTWVYAGTIQVQDVASEVTVRSRRPIEAV